jgi:hypothetical protein
LISFRVGTGIDVGVGAGENRVEHRRSHPAGECVLLAWVITADEQHFARCLLIGQPDFGTVTEPRAWPRQRETALAEHRPYRLPGKSAKANDYSQVSGH